jgi:hypothetical protein
VRRAALSGGEYGGRGGRGRGDGPELAEGGQVDSYSSGNRTVSEQTSWYWLAWQKARPLADCAKSNHPHHGLVDTRLDRRNQCAGDGRLKNEGGARLWSPAQSDTVSVVCLSTYFYRIAFLWVSRKVKVRTLCYVLWPRTSGGSTTARAVALAAGEGTGLVPLPNEIPKPTAPLWAPQ